MRIYYKAYMSGKSYSTITFHFSGSSNYIPTVESSQGNKVQLFFAFKDHWCLPWVQFFLHPVIQTAFVIYVYCLDILALRDS